MECASCGDELEEPTTLYCCVSDPKHNYCKGCATRTSAIVTCKNCLADLCLEDEETEWCAGECGGYVCSKHDESRAECGCIFCEKCAKACPKCDEVVCMNCDDRECEKCGGYTHVDCAIGCAVCKRFVCARCSSRCGSCEIGDTCVECCASHACAGASAAELAFLRWHWERETSKERTGRRYLRETGKNVPPQVV